MNGIFGPEMQWLEWDDLVLTTALSMVLAGSETTAISLSSVFYYLLKNPRTYEKLMED